MIKRIEWDTSEVMVDVMEEDIKNSPEYEPGKAISESYEANLQNYYGETVQSTY